MNKEQVKEFYESIGAGKVFDESGNLSHHYLGVGSVEEYVKLLYKVSEKGGELKGVNVSNYQLVLFTQINDIYSLFLDISIGVDIYEYMDIANRYAVLFKHNGQSPTQSPPEARSLPVTNSGAGDGINTQADTESLRKENKQ